MVEWQNDVCVLSPSMTLTSQMTAYRGFGDSLSQSRKASAHPMPLIRDYILFPFDRNPDQARESLTQSIDASQQAIKLLEKAIEEKRK
jgi:hypothetical protein